MKLTTLVMAFTFFLFGIIVIPLSLMYVSISLGLPIISFPLSKIIGLVSSAAGAAIVFHATFLFFRLGKGTPVPVEPPKKLVIKGLYKYTRNPIYIAYFLVFLGEFLLFGHILLFIYLLLTILFFHSLVVYHEEPILKKRFGASYMEYIKKVPRWLKI